MVSMVFNVGIVSKSPYPPLVTCCAPYRLCQMAHTAHGTRVEHSQTSLMASFRMKLLARHRENVHLNYRNDFSDEPTEH